MNDVKNGNQYEGVLIIVSYNQQIEENAIRL